MAQLYMPQHDKEKKVVGAATTNKIKTFRANNELYIRYDQLSRDLDVLSRLQ